MANIELNVVALGDFSSVSDQITKLKAQVASLNASLTGATGASFDKASASVRSLSNEFSAALTNSGAFTKQTVQLQNETEKFGQSLQNGTLGLGNYYQILTKKQGDTMNSVKALAVEQTKLQNSVIMADPSKQGFYSVFTPKSIDAVANATKIAANEQNIYNTAIKAGSTELINWGKNTQWAGRQLTVGMAMPLLLFGQQAVSTFDSVNTALTQFAKVYGEGLTAPSQSTIDQMSQQVLQLGRNMAATLGISQQFTVEVASSFAAMGKMGTDLTGAVEQTDRLAKLGNLDQQTATNAVIALENVYKLNTTGLADAVNYFGAMQKQTSLSMSDLVQSESRIGPIIEQLGGTYKDSAVMVLAMKEAGVPAAKSANALKSAMASIIAPTTAANKLFAQYGINLGAIKDQKGPVNMILALQSALDKLDPLTKQTLIEKLFGKYQFGNITALIDNLGKAGSQTVNALQVANASSSQLSALANQEIKQATSSPSAQWQIALQTFKADLYPLGQDIIKIGTKLLDFGNKVAKVFSGLPGPVKFFLGLLAGLTVIAGPIIMLTGLMANFVGNILKGVINLKDLVTGGKTMRQLFTPELIAAQNASSLFADGLKGDVDQVKLLTQAITDLTEKLALMKNQMGVGAGIENLKSAVGATAQVETSIFEQMSLPGFAGGVVSLPGPKGAGDVLPAMLSPGESVIPADITQKHLRLIQAIVQDRVPGFASGAVDIDGETTFLSSPGRRSRPGRLNGLSFDAMSASNDLTTGIQVIINAIKEAGIKLSPQQIESYIQSDLAHISHSADYVSSVGGKSISQKTWQLSNLTPAFGVENNFLEQMTGKGRTNNNSYWSSKLDEVQKNLADNITKDQQDAIDNLRLGHQPITEAGIKLYKELVDKISQEASAGIGPIAGSKTQAMLSPVSALQGARLDGTLSRGAVISDSISASELESGKKIGQELSNGINAGMLQANPQESVDQYMERLLSVTKEAGEIHSPSELFAKEVGEPIGQGIQQGYQDTLPGMESIVDTSMMNAAKAASSEDIINAWATSGETAANSIATGITENSGVIVDAANAAADEASVSVLSRIKGAMSGTMGKTGGIGMAMMLPMLTGMLPKTVGGTNISGVTSAVSTGASVGMGASMLGMGAAEGSLMAGLAGMALPIAGVVASLGLLKLAFDDAAARARQDNNTLLSTYTVSSQAVQAFGLSFQPLSNYDFSKVSGGIADHAASIANNKAAVDALTQAYENATDQQTKDYIGQVGKADPKTLLAMMNQKYNTDRSNGMTNDASMQDITSIMQAAGQSALAISRIQQTVTQPSSTKEAFANVVKGTLTDTSTGKAFKAGAGPTGDLKYQDQTQANKQLISELQTAILNDKANLRANPNVPAYQKAYAGDQARLKALQTVNNPTGSTKSVLPTSTVTALQTAIMQLISGPAKNLGDAFNALKGTTQGTMVDNQAVFDALNKQITNTVPELSKYTAYLNKGSGGTQALAQATQLYQVAIKAHLITFSQLTDEMKKGPAALGTFFNSLLPKIQAQIAGQKTDASGNVLPSTPSTGSSSVFTGTTQEKTLQKAIQGSLDSQNAQLKIVKDQLSIQQKISTENKAQLQYQQQITGLQNDMKTAMISGNYLQAATLKQQISGAKVDFNATSVQQKLQDQVDTMQSNADLINQGLQDLKDSISQGISDLSKLPASVEAAHRLSTINAQAVAAGIATGQGPTVTTVIQVTGTVTGTSTTSSHPNTKSTIRTTGVNPGGSKALPSKTTTTRTVK